MIELVDRLEAENERRIAVLFEDDGGKERGFEAVRAAVPHHAAKAAERRAFRLRFRVVGQPIQIALHVEGRAQARDQPALAGRERGARRIDRGVRRADRA